MEGLALHARRSLGRLVTAEETVVASVVRRAARVPERFVFPLPVPRRTETAALP